MGKIFGKLRDKLRLEFCLLMNVENVIPKTLEMQFRHPVFFATRFLNEHKEKLPMTTKPLFTDPLDEIWEGLEPFLPEKVRERVENAVKNNNKRIRESLRRKTGFSLSTIWTGENSSTRVPIEVSDGIPQKLRELLEEYPDIMLWKVLFMQRDLRKMADTFADFSKNWSDFENWRLAPEVFKGSQPAIAKVQQVISEMIDTAQRERLIEKLFGIREDILGCYHFDESSSRISIYWQPIAIFAMILGVRLEDLTVVTLIHELAHAYTHLGGTIDGDPWETRLFKEADLDIVEGLAQFYTHEIAYEWSGMEPGIFEAYTSLLKNQDGPYLAHLTWSNHSTKNSCEVLRATLVEARAKGITDYSDWLTCLLANRERLRQMPKLKRQS